jgi:hypothetical protein
MLFSKKIRVEIICFLLMLLLAYSALSKLLTYPDFSQQLQKSPILYKLADIIAPVTISAELLVSVMLAHMKYRLVGLYSALSLLSMFTMYIVLLIKFGYGVPCSCGGLLQSLSWNGHLVVNGAAILIILLGIVWHCSIHQEAIKTRNLKSKVLLQ